MADTLDLTKDIAEAVNTAGARGTAVILGYVTEEGTPSVSFRGSTQVWGPQRLAIWARKASEGFAAAIAKNPAVSLLYRAEGGPGPVYLTFQGRAHVDPSVNDAVYNSIWEREREQDPEKKGVAVIIDVDVVNGYGANGLFRMERDA